MSPRADGLRDTADVWRPTVTGFSPFMAPLGGSPEFDRIVARAARRVAELGA